MSTPVQRQYAELKQLNPEALLFFRLGDFYELFFEDAIIGSKILGITLTARHKSSDNEMPMAGFPHHSHGPYLEALIEAGYSVAIAEQVTDEDGKISRQIDRVITPGTTLESGNLEPDKNNFLAVIVRPDDVKNSDKYALVYFDLSTGDFFTAQLGTETQLWDECYKVNPKEILLHRQAFLDEKFSKKCPSARLVPQDFPNYKTAEADLKKLLGANALTITGVENMIAVITGMKVCLDYIQHNKSNQRPNLAQIKNYNPSEFLQLDHQTLSHLEVFQPLNNNTAKSTLCSVFEKTSTAMGGRLLRQWLYRPLQSVELINTRQAAVEELFKDSKTTKKLRSTLNEIPDIERICVRLANPRGNARDLQNLGRALAQFKTLENICQNLKTDLNHKQTVNFKNFEDLNLEINNSLVENPPLEITQGGMFKLGFNQDLDTLKKLKSEANNWLEQYLEKVKAETGLSKLRVKYSKNFGYCLEISTAQAKLVPSQWQRRQTLVNAERFTTKDLAEYETRIMSAESDAMALEHQLFLNLRQTTLQRLEDLQRVAKSIALLDVIQTLSETARQRRWYKPIITKENTNLNILEGRHPVVEALSLEPYIANNLHFKKADNLHLITGPNMAGKSTFLRQNALIILLGQIGSYVPAKTAEWSVIDRIFTRVGAADNLAAGKSTFYVEMSETAAILHQATDKSFIILDEIGRGTSTFDGLSIAWAITEHLHNNIKAKTLFATHYHELIDLIDSLEHAQNYHVSVSQHQDGILFLRQIKPGGISDSFGIEVAALAGIPKTVIEKSREILARLENDEKLNTTPNLFSTPRVKEVIVEVPTKSAALEKLSSINPDDLSPKEALELIYELTKTKD